MKTLALLALVLLAGNTQAMNCNQNQPVRIPRGQTVHVHWTDGSDFTWWFEEPEQRPPTASKEKPSTQPPHQAAAPFAMIKE